MHLPFIFAACLLAAGSAFAADITVSAAASLKNAFTEIAAAYEKSHPADRVRLNTAASGVLLRQAEQGAPVDILAFADEATMDKAAAKKLIVPSSRQTFAANTLVLVVPKRGSLKPATPQALRQNGIKRIAIGNPASVPAGAYAKAALEQQNLYRELSAKWVFTQNVRQALDYTARGETDAGFVYRTDALLQADKLQITALIPTATPVRYPLALTASAKQPEAARRFSRFVLSPAGQAVLKKYGFSRP